MRLDYFILIASKLHEDIPVRHAIVKRALKGEILQSRAKIQVIFLRDKILFLDKLHIFKPTCIVPFYYIDDFNTRIFWKLLKIRWNPSEIAKEVFRFFRL